VTVLDVLTINKDVLKEMEEEITYVEKLTSSAALCDSKKRINCQSGQ